MGNIFPKTLDGMSKNTRVQWLILIVLKDYFVMALITSFILTVINKLIMGLTQPPLNISNIIEITFYAILMRYSTDLIGMYLAERKAKRAGLKEHINEVIHISEEIGGYADEYKGDPKTKKILQNIANISKDMAIIIMEEECISENRVMTPVEIDTFLSGFTTLDTIKIKAEFAFPGYKGTRSTTINLDYSIKTGMSPTRTSNEFLEKTFKNLVLIENPELKNKLESSSNSNITEDSLIGTKKFIRLEDLPPDQHLNAIKVRFSGNFTPSRVIIIGVVYHSNTKGLIEKSTIDEIITGITSNIKLGSNLYLEESDLLEL